MKPVTPSRDSREALRLEELKRGEFVRVADLDRAIQEMRKLNPFVELAAWWAREPDDPNLGQRLAWMRDTWPPSLDAAWAEVVAITPKGWLFHGVELEDNSMETGGDWGPGWEAQMTWPGHCQYDDCDHDEAFRVGKGATPLAALLSLIDDFDWTVLPEPWTDVVFSQRRAGS